METNTEVLESEGVEKDRPSSYLGSVFLRDTKTFPGFKKLFLSFAQQMLLALEGVPSVAGMSRKQLMFVLQVRHLVAEKTVFADVGVLLLAVTFI